MQRFPHFFVANRPRVGMDEITHVMDTTGDDFAVVETSKYSNARIVTFIVAGDAVEWYTDCVTPNNETRRAAWYVENGEIRPFPLFT